jgi:formylglycine-generating enzyme required for sulfatase activity
LIGNKAGGVSSFAMDDDKPTQRASADDNETVRTPKKEVVFDRYELLSELGKGGMGIVWLALDRELNSRVALKFLREEMTSEADALKELKGEVIINRDLSHPNIIKTYDFVTNGRSSAISMEYVSGTNLHRMKAQRPGKCFDVEDIRQWVFQLCDAMHYAHQQKVVHRDIKPANLMLTERGEVKVGDFGIGRTVADTVNRVTRNTAGTPPYMSPQQTMGEKAVPTDDVYSIGATIYDLLTGDPPFFRGAIREQTLAKVPPTMAARRQELGRPGKAIPAEWEQAVAACLAKDSAARPPTARALREMLEGKSAAPGAVGKRSRKGGQWLAIAAGLLVLAGIGGAYYWKTQMVPGEPAAKPPSKITTAPSTPGPVTTAPVTTVAPVTPKPSGGGSPVDDFVAAGRITADEGSNLGRALRGQQGDWEKSLAARLLIDRTLSPEDWRKFSSLVPPANENVAKLRPMLAAGMIREKEFGWLDDALAARKGEEELALARQLVDAKTLTPAQWRDQTQLYPHLDPFLEKVKPLIAAGTVTAEEGKWLRDALAGQKSAAEKALATQLVDEKTLTPGQWRARTQFSYVLSDNAVIDPGHLPPAIDLPLNASVSVRLLRIDPGPFVRGSPKDELGRRTNELLPERIVLTKPFYIGIYEVTQAQYTSIVPRSPSYWRGNPNWPIDQVSWRALTGSDGFLERLNRVLAGRYGGALMADLPSEDEWEYACRAGTQTSFNDGKNITSIETDPALDPLANYNRADNGSPRPVGSYQPNAWGLYDMHGNVAEWCQNRYLRGGSWQSNAANCRSAWRTQISADASPSNQIGFRLVLRLRPAGGGSN